MFRSALAALLFVVVVPLSAFGRTPQYADFWNGAEINWRDPKSGIYEASSTGRPVLMLFHATWCGACKKYRAVFADPEIVRASRDFVMILVDVDTEKEVNGAFSPDGTYVPRTLFIDPEGNISDKLVGQDVKYPHTIDIEKPGELLALMTRAKTEMKFPDAAPTASPAPSEDRT